MTRAQHRKHEGGPPWGPAARLVLLLANLIVRVTDWLTDDDGWWWW